MTNFGQCNWENELPLTEMGETVRHGAFVELPSPCKIREVCERLRADVK